MNRWLYSVFIRLNFQPERAADGIGISMGILIGVLLAWWSGLL